jgi:hypothetical protein
MKNFIKTINIFNRLKIFEIHWSLLIALILFIPGAYFVTSFESAMTPSEAISKGYESMPQDWEAGVFQYGKYTQWYLPEKHPLLYFTSWLILLSSILFWYNALIKIRIEINEYQREQKARKLSERRRRFLEQKESK